MTVILVVEDEIIVARDIQTRLKNLGYQMPDFASSGEEAIQKAAAIKPDLILMDIRLKGKLDGIETASHIRAEMDVPIVYLTAHSDEATLQRAKLSEPFGYVLKPYEEQNLYTSIEMALHKHMLESQLRTSQRWLATTLSSIGDAVIATDEDCCVKFLNKVAEELTGWQQSEAVGQPLAEIFRIINQDTRQVVENPAEIAIKQGIVVGLANHTLLIRRDGAEIPIDDSAAPIRDDHGRVWGVVLVFRDVSQRRDLLNRLTWQSSVNATLAEVGQALITPASVEEISILVLDHAQRLTGSEFGYVGFIDPATGHLVCPTMTRDVWSVCEVEQKTNVFTTFAGLWGWVLENRQPVLVNSLLEDCRSTGSPKGHVPINRFLSAPAMMGDQLIGQIALANKPQEYTSLELDFIERLATLYALAVQRVQTEAKYQNLIQELRNQLEEKTTELNQLNQ